jgi:hypothetical protein
VLSQRVRQSAQEAAEAQEAESPAPAGHPRFKLPLPTDSASDE